MISIFFLSSGFQVNKSRDQKIESRRLELSLYIVIQAMFTHLSGVKAKLAPSQKQYNLLTISILITTVSCLRHNGSIYKDNEQTRTFWVNNNTD